MQDQQAMIDEFISCCFSGPQLILSLRNRDNDENVHLENVGLIAVKMLSSVAVKGPSMTVDPLIVRLGFKHDWNALSEINDEDVSSLVQRTRPMCATVGCWTLIHDVVSDKKKDDDGYFPPWRIVAEVSPDRITNACWFVSADSRVLLLDVEGAAVFVGRQSN